MVQMTIFSWLKNLPPFLTIFIHWRVPWLSHVLGSMADATVNTGVHSYLWYNNSLLLDIYYILKGLLGCMVVIFLEGTLHYFPQWLLIYALTDKHWSSSLLFLLTFVISASLIIVILLGWSDSSLHFWFILPWWLVMLHIVLCTCGPFVCFLWEMPI